MAFIQAMALWSVLPPGRRRRTILALGFTLFALHRLASSQTAPAYTRHEISAGIGVNLRDVEGLPPTLLPVGQFLAHDTYNLSPTLGVEATYRYGGGPYYGGSTDGGAETFVGGGVKGSMRHGNWNFFGTLEPGIASFSNGLVYIEANEISKTYRYTHFAIDTSLGVERSLSNRGFLRVEAGALLASEFDQRLFTENLGGGLILYQQTNGRTADFFQSSLSFGYRVGRLREEQEVDATEPHAEFGLLFPLFGRGNLLESQMNMDRGVGTWVSAGLTKHLDFDAAAFQFPRDDHTGDFQDGGKQAMASAGMKVGIRRPKVGLFVKTRAGAIRFSRTYGGGTFPTLDDYLGNPGYKSYQPVVDVGGVVEVYPGHHIVLRGEMGPTIIVYRPTTFSLEGERYSIPANHSTAMLVSFGVGYRF